MIDKVREKEKEKEIFYNIGPKILTRNFAKKISGVERINLAESSSSDDDDHNYDKRDFREEINTTLLLDSFDEIINMLTTEEAKLIHRMEIEQLVVDSYLENKDETISTTDFATMIVKKIRDKREIYKKNGLKTDEEIREEILELYTEQLNSEEDKKNREYRRENFNFNDSKTNAPKLANALNTWGNGPRSNKRIAQETGMHQNHVVFFKSVIRKHKKKETGKRHH